MSTTPKGIVYPDAAGHTQMWRHYQTLAETIDDAIGVATVNPRGDCAGLYMGTVSAATGTWTRPTGYQPDPYFPTIGSAVSNAGGVLRVAYTGMYLINGVAYFTANATGRRGIGFDNNPSATAAYTNRQNGVIRAATTNTQASFTNVLYCQAGDYIRLWAYQDSGGALSLPANSLNFYNAIAL